MRHTRTFKQHPTLVLILVFSSMCLLLGACAERNTPAPLASSPTKTVTVPLTTTSAPGAVVAQASAAPVVSVQPSVAATVRPTQPTAAKTTAVPATTRAAQTATVAVAAKPTAKVAPTATRKAAPTAGKTVVPTPGKADSKADGIGVSILAVNGAKPGKNASATIQTSPLVECAIAYSLPSGVKIIGKGLEKKTSDEDGRITWTWQISETTAPGKGKVSVTCGESTETAPVTIG